MVPAATSQRRVLFATAAVSYAVVFTCFVLFEVPGLGLGHFFYIPVALTALACGTWVGFGGGALAACLCALAILITPRLPTGDVLADHGRGMIGACAQRATCSRSQPVFAS